MIGCRFRLRAEREYSFLLTDFEKETAPLWFDGNVQKMVSVISQRAEVEKYFLWRQLDASANSLKMLASAHYPHAALVEKSNAEKHGCCLQEA